MVTVGVVLMLILIVLVHEFAHILTAKTFGYKLKKLYIGIPISINIKGRKYSATLWKVERNGVEYGVSWLILGGAVDFHEKPNARWWHELLIALMGPVSNLLLAFLGIALVVGLGQAWTASGMIFQLVLEGMAKMVTPEGISTMVGPIGFISEVTIMVKGNFLNWLLMWSLINMALFVTNILPIPALDGGHILLSFIVAIFGEKAKIPARVISYTFLYVLCGLMELILAKEIWFFLLGLLT